MPNELKDETKIYLQVENPDDDGEQIDILNVVSYMAKRKRTYRNRSIHRGIYWITCNRSEIYNR